MHIINPILKIIGWDIEDRERVKIEEKGADYLLISDGGLKVPIEAKGIGTNITREDEDPIGQLKSHVENNESKYGIFTDGNKWELYRLFMSDENKFEQIWQIDIENDEDFLSKLGMISFIHIDKLEENKSKIETRDFLKFDNLVLRKPGLEKTIKKIKEKEELLKSNLNEKTCMYLFINPILRALGWNTRDPDITQPEKTLRMYGKKKNPDYFLKGYEEYEGNNLVLEAKSLNESLSKGIEQLGKYCLISKTKYGILTNGLQWGVYEMIQKEPTLELDHSMYEEFVNEGKIVDELRDLLEKSSFDIPKDAEISKENREMWIVEDGRQMYKLKNKLSTDKNGNRKLKTYLEGEMKEILRINIKNKNSLKEKREKLRKISRKEFKNHFEKLSKENTKKNVTRFEVEKPDGKGKIIIADQEINYYDDYQKLGKTAEWLIDQWAIAKYTKVHNSDLGETKGGSKFLIHPDPSIINRGKSSNPALKLSNGIYMDKCTARAGTKAKQLLEYFNYSDNILKILIPAFHLNKEEYEKYLPNEKGKKLPIPEKLKNVFEKKPWVNVNKISRENEKEWLVTGEKSDNGEKCKFRIELLNKEIQVFKLVQ